MIGECVAAVTQNAYKRRKLGPWCVHGGHGQRMADRPNCVMEGGCCCNPAAAAVAQRTSLKLAIDIAKEVCFQPTLRSNLGST
jgi:hypothetical protein